MDETLRNQRCHLRLSRRSITLLSSRLSAAHGEIFPERGIRSLASLTRDDNAGWVSTLGRVNEYAYLTPDKITRIFQRHRLKYSGNFIKEHKLEFGLLINQASEMLWLTDTILQAPAGCL